jgi:hypothetical protein
VQRQRIGRGFDVFGLLGTVGMTILLALVCLVALGATTAVIDAWRMMRRIKNDTSLARAYQELDNGPPTFAAAATSFREGPVLGKKKRGQTRRPVEIARVLSDEIIDDLTRP